jgi:hypothetical protein
MKIFLKNIKGEVSEFEIAPSDKVHLHSSISSPIRSSTSKKRSSKKKDTKLPSKSSSSKEKTLKTEPPSKN